MRPRVTTGDGASSEVDAVVLTIPCTRIPGICPQLGPPERERLARVEYQGVICASLILDRPLAGYYVLNITDAGFPFTTVIEMTALVDPAVFGGRTLVYLPRYCTRDDSWWQRDDAAVRREFLAGLRRLHPDLAEASVLHATVSRASEVQALPTLHYSRDAVPPLRTSVPGVYIANSAQIVNGTLNANETVALAERASAALLPALSRS
jgi:protoporphyrinogen oxidase